MPTIKTEKYLTAIAANQEGDIFELPGYAAVGMAGRRLEPLRHAAGTPLPHGSELMYLPDRVPVYYNLASRVCEEIAENPYVPGERIFPVAAFNSPGYVIDYTAAYTAPENAVPLPLFSYGAVGFHGKGFRAVVVRVDTERRQDLRYMPLQKVRAGVDNMQKKMPRNRLNQHLSHCALTYGCPAAKNFYLGRFEAPLPTSRSCNARCLGCISLQPKGSGVISCQERIAFIPSSAEIAEVALMHIKRVKKSVVSFGQGCEGDPLMAAEVILPAIHAMRRKTPHGTINMNTNASQPEVLAELFDAGLESIRVSLNSTRKACYHAYFRPQNYTFDDIVASIDLALKRGKFVALNYLNVPGVTDTLEETEALTAFLKAHPVHMIQWRNLNYDPVAYHKVMSEASPQSHPMGMGQLVKQIRGKFPQMRHGYFNPPKEKWPGSAGNYCGISIYRNGGGDEMSDGDCSPLVGGGNQAQ